MIPEELASWLRAFDDSSPPPEVWSELIYEALKSIPKIATALESISQTLAPLDTDAIADAMNHIGDTLKDLVALADQLTILRPLPDLLVGRWRGNGDNPPKPKKKSKLNKIEREGGFGKW